MHPVRVDARGGAGVSPRESGGNRVRMRVEQPNADVECVVVVEDAHLRLVRSRNTWLRVALDECTSRLGSAPCGVVEPAVYHDGRGATRGTHYARWGVGALQRVGLLATGGVREQRNAERERDARAHGGAGRGSQGWKPSLDTGSPGMVRIESLRRS